MAIRIVTDSSADIPPHMLKELGIKVVPLYVRFGNEVFKDKVDISNDEFYNGGKWRPLPSTSQPSPADFKQAYEDWLTERTA
jgi:DegV family protein with EDD domain